MATASVTPYCTCSRHGVTELDWLLDLLAYGFGQQEASMMLWGPSQRDGDDSARLAVYGLAGFGICP